MDNGEICRVPLIVAPPDQAQHQDQYTVFEYVEREAPPSPTKAQYQQPQDQDSPPPFSKFKLHKSHVVTVPDSLEPYIVPYKLVPPNNSSMVGVYPRPKRHIPPHLKNLVVLDSTMSGSQRSSDIYFSVVKPLLDAFGIAHIYVSTAGPDTISQHASSFSSSTTVILLAGDTSVHEFVNSLSPMVDNHRLTLCIVPTGSGNALSNSIGHDGVAHAISRIFLGQAQPLCVVPVKFPQDSYLIRAQPTKVTELQSLMVISWGFHSSLVADSDSPEYRKYGTDRFRMVAKDLLEKNNEIYHGELELYNSDTNSPSTLKSPALQSLSTTHVSGPHSYVLFTSVTRLEKSFLISPRCHPPSSGDVYLLRIGAVQSSEIMDIMNQAYNNGAHIASDKVMYTKLTSSHLQPTTVNNDLLASVKIQDENPAHRRWCVDGEIVMVPQNSVVSIEAPRFEYNKWNLFVVV